MLLFDHLDFKERMKTTYQDYLIRDWQTDDRLAAAAVIQQVLREYGLRNC